MPKRNPILHITHYAVREEAEKRHIQRIFAMNKTSSPTLVLGHCYAAHEALNIAKTLGSLSHDDHKNMSTAVHQAARARLEAIEQAQRKEQHCMRIASSTTH